MKTGITRIGIVMMLALALGGCSYFDAGEDERVMSGPAAARIDLMNRSQSGVPQVYTQDAKQASEEEGEPVQYFRLDSPEDVNAYSPSPGVHIYPLDDEMRSVLTGAR